MGNLHTWGGPLSHHWHARTLFIQKNIVRRMRQIGITPVLSAFNGYVPESFKSKSNKLFGRELKIREIRAFTFFGRNFGISYSLDPTDPLFNELGSAYLREQISEFGTGHVYTCDPYNEMLPPTKDAKGVQTLSKLMFEAMTKVDPSAIWMIQAWAFFYHRIFWTTERVEAFLHGPPLGRMLVLDSQAEHFPLSKKYDSFYGQPFIWCMLHNFGGTTAMYGPMDRINEKTFESRTMNSTMVGTGVAPEGIFQNYVLYDLMAEMGWRNEPVNITQWMQNYTFRRYGKKNLHIFKAWSIFRETVYNYTIEGRMKTSYAIVSTPDLNVWMWMFFNTTRFMEGWDEMILAADDLKDSEGYRYDLVDVTKQALQTLFDIYFFEFKNATILNKNMERSLTAVKYLNSILMDIDKLLLTDRHFLLGPYLEQAKAAATSQVDRRLYEYNARNLITLWGPRGELQDYSARHLAGLMSDYYAPRWKMYLEEMINYYFNKNTSKYELVQKNIRKKIFNTIEKPFTRMNNLYPTLPQGNTIETAKVLYVTWRNKFIQQKITENSKSTWFNFVTVNTLKSLGFIPTSLINILETNIDNIDKA